MNIVEMVTSALDKTDAKLKSKEFLLDKDAAIYALIIMFYTKNRKLTGLFWLIGHFIKIEDITREVKKMIAIPNELIMKYGGKK